MAELLEVGASLNIPGVCFSILLHYAITEAFGSIVELLLSENADPYMPDGFAKPASTPLSSTLT